MRRLLAALVLAVVSSGHALALEIAPKGPWPASKFKRYDAHDALAEAKARFALLNEYAMALIFWRVEIHFEDPRGDANFSVDWRKIEKDPTWGPWLQLARATRLQPSQILFGSEKREPGSFFIDGQVRIAKTGNAPGTPIVINEDLVVRESDEGDLIPLDWLEIAAVIVHEHGHHLDALGLKIPHADLDRHGALVRQLLEKSYRAPEYGAFPPDPILPWAQRPTVYFTGHHEFSQCDLRLVFVRDGDSLYDFTPLMDNEKMCYPHPERRRPHLYPPGSTLTKGPHTVAYLPQSDGKLWGFAKSSSSTEMNSSMIFEFAPLENGLFRFTRALRK